VQGVSWSGNRRRVTRCPLNSIAVNSTEDRHEHCQGSWAPYAFSSINWFSAPRALQRVRPEAVQCLALRRWKKGQGNGSDNSVDLQQITDAFSRMQFIGMWSTLVLGTRSGIGDLIKSLRGLHGCDLADIIRYAYTFRGDTWASPCADLDARMLGFPFLPQPPPYAMARRSPWPLTGCGR